MTMTYDADKHAQRLIRYHGSARNALAKVLRFPRTSLAKDGAEFNEAEHGKLVHALNKWQLSPNGR